MSYNYTSTTASKLFNYKQTLQDINIEHLNGIPPKCSCSSYPNNFSPAGHVITSDIKLANNEGLRSLIMKVPKSMEP